MANYDTMTIAAQGAPVNMMHLGPESSGMAAQQYGHSIDFTQDAMYNGLHGDLSGMGFQPTYDLHAFGPGTFDDPSYHSGLFENYVDQQVSNVEPTSVDLDNKLLGFGPPIHKSAVLDAAGQTWPRVTASLNGMFCVAEDVFDGDDVSRPLELTCYRRNLFQISGTIVLSRTAGHVLLDQRRRVAIYDLHATLSATESIEGKPTEIISVPWKSAAGAGGSEEKSGSAPASIPIDLTSNQETDPVFVSIPVAWGRLQFKYATANNGRRKGLQQHYQAKITLMARVEGDGQLVKLAEIQSNPIVVRGRSPKNFDSSKDIHLSERKADSSSRTKSSTSAGNATTATAAHPATNSSQWIEPALSQGSQTYYSQQGFPQALDVTNWTPQPAPVTPEPKAKRPASASPMAQRHRPPVPQTVWKNEPGDEPPVVQAVSQAPTSLAISDEEEEEEYQDDFAIEETITRTPLPPKLRRRGTYGSVTSPLEADDQLYEYFPLSIDDWQPPVDAIYRPHVVHHLRTIPADAKMHPFPSHGKPKRYFSQTVDD